MPMSTYCCILECRHKTTDLHGCGNGNITAVSRGFLAGVGMNGRIHGTAAMWRWVKKSTWEYRGIGKRSARLFYLHVWTM